MTRIYNRPAESSSSTSSVDSAEVALLSSKINTLSNQKLSTYVSGTSYAQDQFVTHKQVLYRALQGTIQEPPGINWSLDVKGLQPADLTIQPFTGQTFQINEYCLYLNNIYQASAITSTPPPSASWNLILCGQLGDVLPVADTLARRRADGSLDVGNPSSSSSAVPKTYLDNVLAGFSWKNSCRLRTVAQLPAYTRTTDQYTSTAFAALSVDGVVVALNDRILIDVISPSSDGGIFVQTQVGTASVPWILTRSADTSTMTTGTGCAITAGATSALQQYILQTTGTIVNGTTPLVWTRFSSGTVDLVGDVQGTSNATTIADSTVTSKLLTGYAGIVGLYATDTILAALTKLGGVIYSATTSNTPGTLVRRSGLTASIDVGTFNAYGAILMQPSTQATKMISLFNSGVVGDTSDCRFYGIGVNTVSQIMYMVDNSSASHSFRFARSATLSTEMARIDGTGIMHLPMASGGIKLPSVGGSPSLFNHYEQLDEQSSWLFGNLSVGPITTRFVRIGSVVHCSNLNEVNTYSAGASGNVGFVRLKAIPVRFRTGTNTVTPVKIMENGVIRTSGLSNVKGGSFNVYADYNGGAFTGAGNHILYEFNTSWMVA